MPPMHDYKSQRGKTSSPPTEFIIYLILLA